MTLSNTRLQEMNETINQLRNERDELQNKLDERISEDDALYYKQAYQDMKSLYRSLTIVHSDIKRECEELRKYKSKYKEIREYIINKADATPSSHRYINLLNKVKDIEEEYK